jgi:hypothetical protein
MLSLSTGGLFRRHLTGLAAGVAAVSLAAGAAGAPAAQAAARSTDVTLINQTGCDLHRADYWLDHGEWWHVPPDYIEPGQQATWVSESNGILTGTEGHVRFITSDCANRELRHKVIQVHWANPYVGANSYDYDGTDPAFRLPHNGGGGSNALVTFFAQLN